MIKELKFYKKSLAVLLLSIMTISCSKNAPEAESSSSAALAVQSSSSSESVSGVGTSSTLPESSSGGSNFTSSSVLMSSVASMSSTSQCNYYPQVGKVVCGYNCQYFSQTNQVACGSLPDDTCNYFSETGQVSCGKSCKYFYQTGEVRCGYNCDYYYQTGQVACSKNSWESCNYYSQTNEVKCGSNCQYFYQTNQVACSDNPWESCNYYYQTDKVECGNSCNYYSQANQVACATHSWDTCNYYYQTGQVNCGYNCEYFYQTNQVFCAAEVQGGCHTFPQNNQTICGYNCAYFPQTQQAYCGNSSVETCQYFPQVKDVYCGQACQYDSVAKQVECGNFNTSPPPAPTNIVFSSVSASGFKVSWQSGGGSTTGYKVAYSSSGQPNCQQGTDVNAATFFTLSGLAADTTYKVQVCAYSSLNNYSEGVLGSQLTSFGTDISGTWAFGSYEFPITQSGKNFTVVWFGVNHPGVFLNPTKIYMEGLTGTVDTINGIITWSNGGIYTRPLAVPNISGTWAYNSYEFPITQAGRNFTVVWFGVNHPGVFLTATKISMDGITGTVDLANGTIIWSNGGVYTRPLAVPDISGNWTFGNYEFPITQAGRNFTVFWFGVSHQGVFLSPTQISMDALIGTVDTASGTITWSNGGVYARPIVAPDISGTWAFGSYEFPITQSGKNFTVVWFGVSHPGVFLSPTKISMDTITGTVDLANGTITWSNGGVYTRPIAVPDISGTWAFGSYEFPITQSGRNFTVIWFGVNHPGVFLSPTQISMDGITGTLNAANSVINWSNGGVYSRH